MKKFLLLTLILLSIPALGQKRAFQLADLYKIKGVADPHFSPDGKRIAFVVTESNLEKGKSNQDVYVINADGSGLKNLTNNPSADNTPRWTRDGNWILFVSSREKGSQTWRINPDGGDAERLTDFAMGTSDPQLSPDGNTLLFSADVYTDCGADNECNAYNDSTQSNGPVQAHMADGLLYRHWNGWKEGKVTHILTYSLVTKQYKDITPGQYESPSWEQGGIGYSFFNDGKSICYVSNHDPIEAASTNKDLWVTGLNGGDAKNITSSNMAYDGQPVFSPDGKYIAYKVQAIPKYESDCLRIALYDIKAGTSQILTESFDNWVNDYQWSPDSKSLYFTGQVKGHVPLYRLDIASKKITPVLDLKTMDAFDLSADGKSIVTVRRSINEPAELWIASSKGTDAHRLTTLNKGVEDEVDLRPAEELWITSSNGAKIHTFLIKPHGFDPSKKYPLIINVHGGPQSQWADAFRGDWQMYPGSGYVLAFPNPHGSTGYGQEFTAAISKDWNGKVYEDVMSVTDSVEKLPYVDKDRVGAMGWSYGGYMMMWLEGHTTRFKAIASMMGVYDLAAMHGATEELWFPEWELNGLPTKSDLYNKFSPHAAADNFKTPCLVITGEKDFRVPYTQSLEFFTDLQQRGVPSRLVVFPNDGHWPSGVKSMPLYYNAHLDWFHKYLGGNPAPYDMTKMVRNQAFEKKDKNTPNQ